MYTFWVKKNPRLAGAILYDYVLGIQLGTSDVDGCGNFEDVVGEILAVLVFNCGGHVCISTCNLIIRSG